MSLLPYYAIIKDSFRAALANKVLFVLFGLITLVLLAVAPLHLRESVSWEIGPIGLRQSISAAANELFTNRESNPVIANIWSQLPGETQADIEELVSNKTDEAPADDANEGRRRRRGGPGDTPEERLAGKLVEDLNAIISKPGFYDAELWKKTILRTEATEMIDEGVDQLSDIRRKRLNRLLLSDAVRSLPAPESVSNKVYYAIWHFSFLPSDMSRNQIHSFVLTSLSWILDKFVLSIGILIAIIVTASIIPDMFEPGSLNLLLSKPISRVGLYLSKFFGGTAFIAMCAVYLFVGLWLWMGIALGVWERALLWSIPLYVLSFAIYFSVSAFVGLLYRSPIVSVILTAVFWAFCFVIGTVYYFMNTYAQNSQVVWFGEYGDKTYAVNKFRQLEEYSPSSNSFNVIPISELGQEEQIQIGTIRFAADMPLFRGSAPVRDAVTGAMGYLEFRAFPPVGYDSATIGILREGQSSPTRMSAPRHVQLLATQHGLVLVTTGGRFDLLDLDKIKNNDGTAKSIYEIAEGLKEIGPDRPIPVIAPGRVVYDPQTDSIVSFAGQQLSVNEWQVDKFVTTKRLKIENGGNTSNLPAIVGARGQYAVVAFANARVYLVDLESMKVVNSYQPETKDPPNQIACDEQGRFHIVYRGGHVWAVAPSSPEKIVLSDLPNQGSITGLSIDTDGNKHLTHHIDRMTTIRNGSSDETLYPAGGFMLTAYRMVVRPFYLISPKPSEFYRVVTYLSSAASSEYDPSKDLTEQEHSPNPWSPVTSGVAFMTVMLVVACIYFSRMDC
ncbi:MAG: ABC transporter permease [Pirellulaceae bacterium]